MSEPKKTKLIRLQLRVNSAQEKLEQAPYFDPIRKRTYTVAERRSILEHRARLLARAINARFS